MSKIKTARSKSGFDTLGIWDDTVPWGQLIGKALVDNRGNLRVVKSVNFTSGTITTKDGEIVPGWKVDQDWLGMTTAKDYRKEDWAR